ncbi:MAG: hypothetical protein K6E29_00655 [Cyanobacteria bacterium RUI128]|nr:hypothetical protein [Cyanobacteria bacterium RUI128]
MSIIQNLVSAGNNKKAQQFEDWTVQVGKGDPNAAKSIELFPDNFNSLSEYKAQLRDISNAYIAIIDKDGDGKISYDEFEKHNIDQAKENIPGISSQQLNGYKQTLRTIYDRLDVDKQDKSKDNLDVREIMNYFFIMDSSNDDLQIDGTVTQSEYELSSKLLADGTETGNKFGACVQKLYDYLFKS